MAVHLSKGSVINGYTVTGPLGGGAEGRVYQAKRSSGGPCALKQNGCSVSDPENAVEVRRVMRRQGLIGKRHPCVAEVFDVFTYEDLLYEVFELVRGSPLDRLLFDRGRLSISESEPIFDCVLQGLAWLHEQGLVHRDIKPGNIMVTPDGGGKIIDFGIALAVGLSRLTRRTPPCTPAYAPIEVMAGGDEVIDGRSDLYSVGATLYETLTGCLPFPDADEKAMVRAKAAGRFDPVLNHAPDIPPEVDTFVTRLLQPLAENRYATAGEAREALRTACGSRKKPSHSSAPAPPSAEAAGPHPSADKLIEAMRFSEVVAPALPGFPSPMPAPASAGYSGAPGLVGMESARFPAEPVYPSRESAVCAPGPHVRVLDGPKAGTLVAIPAKGLSVGRDELNVEDATISRVHAHLAAKRGALHVAASNAMNGVLVDGRRFRKVRVKPGQEFMMGMTRLCFEDSGGR